MAKKRPYDLVGNIIAFETGELSPPSILRLFSHLVKTGKAWSLQGSYGRTAHALIQNGYLSQDGKILREVEEA